jgi:hypothetical protein
LGAFRDPTRATLDRFRYEDVRIPDVLVMGNQELWEAMAVGWDHLERRREHRQK